MGRKPIGKRAMTPAERQRRRRKKLKRERSAEARRKERLRRRDEHALEYQTMPPGVTYWREVTVQTDEGEREVFAPVTRPLAVCETALDDEEVRQLLRQLVRMAKARGIEIPDDEPLDDPTSASLIQARDVREEPPHDSVTIGPKP